MAVEKATVEQALTERGLDLGLADNLTALEDEDALKAVLDGTTPNLPESVEALEKDEKLKKLFTDFSDKRVNDAVKSNMTRLKREGRLVAKKTKTKKETDDDDLDLDLEDEDEAPPTWAKGIIDRLDKAELDQKQAALQSILKKVAEKEGLADPDLLTDISIPDDADEAKITELVKARTAWLTKHGIKNFGTPGGGQNKQGMNAKTKEAVTGFFDKKKAQKESKKS